MADEHHRATAEFADDLHHVVGVALQAAVAHWIVGGQVGGATAHQVEAHDAVAVGIGGLQQTPHVLVAAKAVRQDQRHRTTARDIDVVALLDTHAKGSRC